MNDLALPTVCRRLRVRGLVQGVGFRPFVYRLAHELGLNGWVRNDAEGVDIEARGPVAAVDRLAARLGTEAPVLARVDAVEVREAAPEGGRALPGFLIVDSRGGHAATAIGPDAAICRDCLAELLDPANRRYRYAFTHCTHCGPRYSISRSLPYDRATTAYAAFPLCPACGAEYADPRDRRFHAEANACPACGPALTLLDGSGAPLPGDPVAATLRLIREGRIVAIKGYGGFHLACDAGNADAVAELRRRKHREEKPFAVMLANVGAALEVCEVGADTAGMLELPERPVVLARKQPGADAALPGVAPGLAWLGVMLPYAPLHYLLFHEAAGRPAGTGWLAEPQPLALVMTSANPGGEPLVTGNAEALARLAGIADAFLLNDRDIVVRSDDSVLRVAGGAVQFLRRGRGQTPRPIKLAAGGPAVLAFGGHLKNTVCVLRGDEAYVSQHVGDLDNAATIGFLEETAAHLCRVLDVTPEVVAHDLHPDYASTRIAVAFAAERGIPTVAVGHHHAHVAAVLAETGWQGGPAIGLALDGVGLGADGGLWGGELLQVDGAACDRIGHLTPLRLPGGDRAAREPWRLAAAALHRLGRSAEIPDFIARRFPSQAGAEVVRDMLAKGFNSLETSSLGRHFDAAAGLLGLRAAMRFEAQAAMELEGAAESWTAAHGAPEPLAAGWRIDAAGRLDLDPLFAALADCDDAGHGAALFHTAVAAALTEWAAAAAETRGIRAVALGGGCFLNHLLAEGVRTGLAARGLTVLEARQAPPNDGGLALGQGWVARRSHWGGI